MSTTADSSPKPSTASWAKWLLLAAAVIALDQWTKALIVSQLGLGFWPQIITFIVLSALSMLLVRPFAKKFLRPGYSPTNADRVIGATGLVTEEIDNLAGHGLVNIAGQVWSARSAGEGAVIPAGQEVRVTQIQGVKVLVEPVQSGGPEH